MGVRQQFDLKTEFRYDADNVAVDALLMVIEDALGRSAVRSGEDEQSGSRWARVQWVAPEADARQVNWLHEQLRAIGKYVLEPAEVRCSDAEGREQGYWLSGDMPQREPAPAEVDEAPAEVPPEPSDLAEDDEMSAAAADAPRRAVREGSV